MSLPDGKKNVVQARKTRNILKKSYSWRLNNQSLVNLYKSKTHQPLTGFGTLSGVQDFSPTWSECGMWGYKDDADKGVLKG
ncbi:hypothetical protein Barb4_02710 [Bacteroidales bacterium Barb4]|nr:hypothetical protein Barb4_02710 [Bacteroidales bacterium Barb4]